MQWAWQGLWWARHILWWVWPGCPLVAAGTVIICGGGRENTGRELQVGYESKVSIDCGSATIGLGRIQCNPTQGCLAWRTFKCGFFQKVQVHRLTINDSLSCGLHTSVHLSFCCPFLAGEARIWLPTGWLLLDRSHRFHSQI